VGGRKLPFPILKASGLYNSLYYRTSRDYCLLSMLPEITEDTVKPSGLSEKLKIKNNGCKTSLLSLFNIVCHYSRVIIAVHIK